MALAKQVQCKISFICIRLYICFSLLFLSNFIILHKHSGALMILAVFNSCSQTFHNAVFMFWQNSGKLEKAEILEMTVQYLRALHSADFPRGREKGQTTLSASYHNLLSACLFFVMLIRLGYWSI